jgi:DNA polymerase-1
MEKLVLVDGNSIAYRAFFALPALTNSKGQYTNAAYGFTNILLKILDEEKPTHILIAFDAGKTVFRHKDFEQYKGTRQTTPPELREQFPMIRDLLDAYGICRYELEGYEADDIIGTISLLAEKEGIPTRIVTGDKDMLQLISPHVQVGLTRKGSDIEWYDEAALWERYNLRPDQIRDLKGLMGDTSDNIPGIPGVGEKTALKFLYEYETVEGLLANIDKLKGKIKEKVEENKHLAILSKELATIYRDVPTELTIDSLRYEGYDADKVRKILMELEFRSLLNRIKSDESATDEAAEEIGSKSYAEITFIQATEENADQLEEYLTSPAAIHVEIDGTNPHRSPIIGMTVASEKGIIAVSPEMIKRWERLVQWLQDDRQAKWAYDGKAAIVALHKLGIELKGVEFDLLLAAYLINPSAPEYHLDQIVAETGKYALPMDDEVYGKGAKRKLPEAEVLFRHLAHKAKAILLSKAALEEQLEEREVGGLYYDLELPLSRVLASMEIAGISVDRNRLIEMGKELDYEIERLTNEIYRIAGCEFNINSTKQLGEILFERLGLPPIKKTKTGYSTDADTLEKLQYQHEIIPNLLHYRTLVKLNSTYVEGLLKEIHDEDGKIHTSFNQSIAATGRLSSIEPNLQNIPIRIEEGRRIRQAFVPSEKDWLILAADYSQIELRILAHLSGDKNLIEAFKNDMDIHTRTAMDVFGVSADQVTSLMRRQAKAVNFGIVYGISDYGLSQNLGITRKEAAQFIERYFTIFSGVKTYMEEIVQTARKQGFVTTLLNRRRYLPEIMDRNFNRRSFAERTAMNTPIQGTAADIIKKAMVLMDEKMRELKVKSRMLLQVHDELVFEVPSDELEVMKQLVPDVMEHALTLSVPLKVDVSYGPTWYEAK